ncbi:phosphopantetheine-binding protein, partial [Streptomyces sp. NPDC059455]|uniref:phosphopantetheine-binding protein n=1 Tax=Streptomyces sp. NPDC059455 TaxID=3346837 RepID=UPI0036A87193
PGTSLAWGWWQREGGMTAHLTQTDHDRMTRAGIHGLTDTEGTALFDTTLDHGLGTVAPVKLHLPTIGRSSNVPPVLRALVRTARPTAHQTTAHTEGWADRVATLAAEERSRAVLDLIRQQSARVLGHSDADRIDPGQAFKDTGFDSLTAVEFRNRVTAATGLRLPATLIFDHPTPNTLADHLLAQLGPLGDGGSSFPEVLRDLERFERQLFDNQPDDEAGTAIADRLRSILARLDAPAAAPAAATGSAQVLDALEDASESELLSFIDKEFGRASN